MSGSRYFLDTNAIIQLLAGNQGILTVLNQAEYVATSVICELEFLAFPDLSDDDKELFEQLKVQIRVTDVRSGDTQLKQKILELRTEKKMKIPDAIIAASAMQSDCVLLTADRQLLNHQGINAESYSV
jgi:predicted nucleic acid-binding protein